MIQGKGGVAGDQLVKLASSSFSEIRELDPRMGLVSMTGRTVNVEKRIYQGVQTCYKFDAGHLGMVTCTPDTKFLTGDGIAQTPYEMGWTPVDAKISAVYLIEMTGENNCQLISGAVLAGVKRYG